MEIEAFPPGQGSLGTVIQTCQEWEMGGTDKEWLKASSLVIFQVGRATSSVENMAPKGCLLNGKH